MELIAVALGKDVAAWMPAALMVMKYAREPATQPASQSASQLAPEPAKDGATPHAAEKPAPPAEPKQ